MIREVVDGFKRRLTVERFLLRLPNANVVMVALIRGRVSVEMFVRAIAGLMERNPLLRSRVELDEGGTARAMTGRYLGGRSRGSGTP